MTVYDQIFYPILGAGFAAAMVASYLAARKPGCLLPGVLLGAGVLALWAGMFIGSDVGYRVWQSIPDPPAEAFSDAFPLGALLFGWFPAGVFCSVVFVTVRLVRHGLSLRRTSRTPR